MPEINKKTEEELLKIVHRVKQDNEEYLKGERVENEQQRITPIDQTAYENLSDEDLWDEEMCPDTMIRLLHNRNVLKSNPGVMNAMEERGRERLDQKRKQDIKAKRKLMGENNNPIKFK